MIVRGAVLLGIGLLMLAAFVFSWDAVAGPEAELPLLVDARPATAIVCNPAIPLDLTRQRRDTRRIA